jgi:hypothetical protein
MIKFLDNENFVFSTHHLIYNAKMFMIFFFEIYANKFSVLHYISIRKEFKGCINNTLNIE